MNEIKELQSKVSFLAGYISALEKYDTQENKLLMTESVDNYENQKEIVTNFKLVELKEKYATLCDLVDDLLYNFSNDFKEGDNIDFYLDAVRNFMIENKYKKR